MKYSKSFDPPTQDTVNTYKVGIYIQASTLSIISQYSLMWKPFYLNMSHSIHIYALTGQQHEKNIIQFKLKVNQ